MHLHSKYSGYARLLREFCTKQTWELHNCRKGPGRCKKPYKNSKGSISKNLRIFFPSYLGSFKSSGVLSGFLKATEAVFPPPLTHPTGNPIMSYMLWGCLCTVSCVTHLHYRNPYPLLGCVGIFQPITNALTILPLPIKILRADFIICILHIRPMFLALGH